MNTSKVLRTYGTKNRRCLAAPSSPPSTLSSSPPPSPRVDRPSKRALMEDDENATPVPPVNKKTKLIPKASTSKLPLKKPPTKKTVTRQKTLTQLHFNIDQSILRTCSLCDLSYTKGAPDDEALHKTHCASVRQGLEWGREEEKERLKGTVIEIESGVALRGAKKKKGRILCIPADIGGRIGVKVSALLHTINLSLSAPALLPSVLQSSKVYVFLVPHETAAHRERIVGCVVAQRISTAMAVVADSNSVPKDGAPAPVVVDSQTNLFCDPTPLPTPMGIPRLFVSSAHRRLGIAESLLNAAAKTFIHGCPLDPLEGQVAFSQPTGMGQAVMKKWGKGSVRVFEE